MWGKWGRGVYALNFEKKSPIRSPNNSASRGVLALVGEIGGIGSGGKTIQLSKAPQIMAASDRIAVGAQKKRLVLWILSNGGCIFILSCLM